MSESNSSRALAAAIAAGRELGIDVGEAKVLHDVFSVVVHLTPAPVVVRVPIVLPPSVRTDLDLQARRQRDELAVVGWLHENGHPVVPPAHPEPVQRDGFSMTFWQLVPIGDAEPDYALGCRLTAKLHEALADYPGELPFMSFLDDTIPASFDHIGEYLSADEIQRARDEWEVLQPLRTREGWEQAFPEVPVQVIHGDSPPFNLIGELCSDFECVTVGPREWDLTLVGPELEGLYNEAAQQPLDEKAMQVLNTARMLQVVSCLALIPQLPMLAEGLEQPLDVWRSMAQLTAIRRV